MHIPLIVHVLAGAIALVTGYVALYASKGGQLHRRAGMVFAYSMLVMAGLGIIVTIARDVAMALNVTAGLVTIYLVVTSLMTVRPASFWTRGTMTAAMALAASVGIASTVFGLEALAGRTRGGMPAFPYLMFGTVALFGAGGDWRLLRSGTLRGAERLSRHLWRMTFALLIAAMSFFLGQAKVIPKPLRIPGLLALPVLAVLVTMIYWMWRIRRRPANASHTPPQASLSLP